MPGYLLVVLPVDLPVVLPVVNAVLQCKVYRNRLSLEIAQLSSAYSRSIIYTQVFGVGMGVVHRRLLCPHNLILLGAVAGVALGSEGDYKDYLVQGINCKDGNVIPLWNYQSYDSHGFPYGSTLRAFVSISALLYLLLGVAVYLNKMMEGVETLTSIMKKMEVTDPETSQTHDVIVKVWDQGLANIMMVLCSYSPHICLCITAVSSMGFISPDLAPLTVMGSSAFTLFIAVGAVISAVPKDQAKKP